MSIVEQFGERESDKRRKIPLLSDVFPSMLLETAVVVASGVAIRSVGCLVVDYSLRSFRYPDPNPTPVATVTPISTRLVSHRQARYGFATNRISGNWIELLNNVPT